MNKHKMKSQLMLLSVLISFLNGIAQTVSHISGTVVEYKDDAEALTNHFLCENSNSGYV